MNHRPVHVEFHLFKNIILQVFFVCFYSGYICSVPGCSEAFSKFSELAVHIRSHGMLLLEVRF